MRLLLLALLVSPALAQRGSPTGVGARVEDYLVRCEAHGWSGVALVVHNGRVILERGYGLADRGAGIANAPDTVFEIASATKPITACAVLALVEDGRIELDAPIANYLPAVPADKRAITVRQLLAHTSGMSRSAGGGAGDDLAAAVAAYLSSPLARQPGTEHEYWNGGFALLAGIVEAVAAEGYLGVCRQRVFARAGMGASGFAGDTSWPANRVALGYADDAPVRRANEHAYGAYDYRYRGMGGVVATAHDLWEFARALGAGKILGRATLASAWTAIDDQYGLGFAVTKTKRGTRRIGHGGDVRGFQTQWQLFPDERGAVILLSNVDGVPLWQIAWNTEALLFGDSLPYPEPPKIHALRARDLEARAGRYELPSEGGALIVSATARGLGITAEGNGAIGLLTGEASGAAPTAAIARARALFDAVRNGDHETIERALIDDIPRSWPRRLVETIWPEHLKTWGELRDVSLLGARATERGSEVTFGLAHERGRPCLAIALQGERLSIFDLKAEAPLVTRPFTPGEGGWFHAFAWTPDSTSAPRLRFELAGGRVRRMEFATMDGRTVALERER